jgi:hypothetical protein
VSDLGLGGRAKPRSLLKCALAGTRRFFRLQTYVRRYNRELGYLTGEKQVEGVNIGVIHPNINYIGTFTRDREKLKKGVEESYNLTKKIFGEVT